MSKGKDNQYFTTTIIHGETLKKSETNEMWVCRVMEGEAVVSYELREQTVRKGDAFVVMEGEMFLLVSSSKEMAMEVMVLRSTFLNVVYPFLGPEVNWSLAGGPLSLFGQMELPYGQMLLLDCESPACMLRHPDKLMDNKLMLSMTAHFLLTYYKASIAEIENSKLNQQLADRFAFPDQSAFGQYFAHQVRGAHHKRHTGLSLTEFRKTR